jgi:hypothetical protein
VARKLWRVGIAVRKNSPLGGLLSLLLACGPPPSTSNPVPNGTAGDVGGASADASPAPMFDASVEEAVPAPSPSPAEASFRRVLAALLEGSARAVREMVPAGGLLVLHSNVCRKPIYGVGSCREERVEAERRRIGDDVLAPFQDLLARAALADGGFGIDALGAGCAEVEGRRWRCATELWLGTDACRGDQRVPVAAVLLDGGEEWVLVELSYEESILLCD